MSNLSFRTPFSSAPEARRFVRRYKSEDAKQKIRDKDAFAAGRELLYDRNIEVNARTIYRWKLQSFMRYPWVKKFPAKTIYPALKRAIDAAKRATPTRCIFALEQLDAIPGVGIPVASAFLTTMHPDKFTIIDSQAYRALGAPYRTTIPEYLRYLRFCCREAKRLGITLREHDQALWQCGAELGRLRRGQRSF